MRKIRQKKISFLEQVNLFLRQCEKLIRDYIPSHSLHFSTVDRRPCGSNPPWRVVIMGS